MIIELNPQSQLPLYKQLIDEITYRVAIGNIKNDDRLPSIRHLSSSLRVNPNTVIKAYRELEYLGYAYSEHGVGYFVSNEAMGRARKEWQEKALLELKSTLFRAFSLGISRAMIIQIIDQITDGGLQND